MSYDETVRYEVADRVATATLNRPEVLNAVTMDMEETLVERLDPSDVGFDRWRQSGLTHRAHTPG